MATEEAVITSGPAITSDGNEDIQNPSSNGSSPDNKGEGIDWKARYDSSTEGALKLKSDLAEAKARLEVLERSRSAAEQSEQRRSTAFVSEDSFIKAYEDRGLPAESARLLYQQEKFNHDTRQFQLAQIRMLSDKLASMEDNHARLAVESNPAAKEAKEFWADNPVMSALPIADLMREHARVKERLGVQVKGRDLTEVKKAAGGSVGSTGRSAAVSFSEEDDIQAQRDGFPSAAAMKAYENVKNIDQHMQWEAKWKKGK